jgi:hypothetical protein
MGAANTVSMPTRMAEGAVSETSPLCRKEQDVETPIRPALQVVPEQCDPIYSLRMPVQVIASQTPPP